MYGEGFSPINEPKLTYEGRELMKTINKALDGSLIRSGKITLRSKEFDILLDAVIPSFKNDCRDVIPHKGKSIVRGK